MLKITSDNIGRFGICVTSDSVVVDAVKLIDRVKVRTSWGDFLAKKGDYLLVNNIKDYYICDGEIFNKTYELI
jgi:hypothetical protein